MAEPLPVMLDRPITGPSAWLRRDVRAEAESVAEWDARARAAGMGAYERATLAAMFRYYAAHGLIGNSNTLHWLLGRAPASLADFLARAAAGTDA